MLPMPLTLAITKSRFINQIFLSIDEIITQLLNLIKHDCEFPSPLAISLVRTLVYDFKYSFDNKFFLVAMMTSLPIRLF
ncbi:hypothetical protein DSAG12_03121 [Promethearchaeum syntrophicum]|uniref:Uncharacterized protein n=1 Tax=Promethearchaeum syntrophicum TaxID=2594042 RepID=A0A5B9DD94_9ARCH|nr:hypothetical protein [Candidatus Prometheoarchaeum syntrophicum]QEE17289.1 hypothetical protein DSAG12_03121 [Candidatus Prometheoarchaeum syntrophicum]